MLNSRYRTTFPQPTMENENHDGDAGKAVESVLRRTELRNTRSYEGRVDQLIQFEAIEHALRLARRSGRQWSSLPLQDGGFNLEQHLSEGLGMPVDQNVCDFLDVVFFVRSSLGELDLELV